ncbi:MULTISPECIES: ABC transporter substrate-binding protein [unclassified Actinotalea]|uniref:ABC transporter substrate-binding protein n=1 Tax=unclassified Actinotalea TaxID=2638618 RepID=UPI0015F3B152|nr:MULTISPECIES: extracellular solute-binding protein [unclassified Actinotalea]
MTARTTRPPARRRTAAAALVMCAATALAACSGADADPQEPTASGDEQEQVRLRFSWWGNDNRHQTTEQVLDLFEEKYPHIEVVGEYSDWGGYWDKLSTSVAAGDAPDVITQEERYLREYGSRGVLADLAELDAIGTDDLDPSVASAGEFEGALYGIPTGTLTAAVLADPATFEVAGVPMPDEDTWTWQDYVDTAVAISAATPEGTYGAQDHGFSEVAFAIYARQHGEELYAQDGTLGFETQTLADFFEMSVELRDSGGTPPASTSIEINADSTRSLMATGTGGMGVWWTSQLGPTEDASGRTLELLRMPGETAGERTGMYVKPSMYYSISADSEHPEEAALLVDFLLNDVEAGRLILSDRGLPVNLEVRAALESDFTDADRRAAEFMERVAPTIEDSLNTPPIGAGEVAGIMARMNEQVLFDRLTPQEAAEQFVSEVEAVIG